MFKMTEDNITNFIGRNVYTADKILVTNFYDRLIGELINDGFSISYTDQNLSSKIIPHMLTIQQGDAEPKKFSLAISEDM